MSDLTDLQSLYSFPANITVDDIEILEHFRYNLSHMYEHFSVSYGVLAILIFLYGSTALVAIIGNAMVIFVVVTKRNMRTTTNVLIVNLAVADIIIGIFTIPFQFHAAFLQRWVFTESMCKVAPFVKSLSVNVSILTLTLIAFDRYIAVMYPLRAGIRKQFEILVLCVVWFLSILLSIPEAIYYDTIYVFDPEIWSKKLECTAKWPSENFIQLYFILLLLSQYIVPLVIISVSYIRIANKIWKSKPPGHLMEARNRIRDMQKKKVFIMLIIVVSLFAFCWLPLKTYNLIAAFYPDVNKYKYINIIWFFINWLAMSNSCYNPFIYGLLNDKFKREFKRLPKNCQCRTDKQTPIIYSAYMYYKCKDNQNKTNIFHRGSDECQTIMNSRTLSIGQNRSSLSNQTTATNL